MTTRPSDVPNTTVEELCSLPVVCLKTANFDLTLGDIIKDKNTVIDIWTTRCTRCPAALDTLNKFASDTTTLPANGSSKTSRESIHCVSICCGDTLDGAREIIETTKVPRWDATQHYFMDYNDKERCKQLLNFRQVPFYVVFHSSGKLLYSGNQKMDWSALFQENSNQFTLERQLQTLNTKMINISDVLVHSPTSATQCQQAHDEVSTAFVIDDMDF